MKRYLLLLIMTCGIYCPNMAHGTCLPIIWNSPKALAMFSPEQEDTPKDSPCHGCGVFNKCRKQLAKRVCYVDIAKINQGDSFGLPDPRCPMAKNVDVIL